MANSTNLNDNNHYTMPIKELNKIKALAVKSYEKESLQKMIDALSQFSNLSQQEKYCQLKQIIIKLQDMQSQQKANWFKLVEEKHRQTNGSLKQIEIRLKLKKLSKVIIQLGDTIDMMFDIVREQKASVNQSVQRL